jgi:hypothetical protein
MRSFLAVAILLPLCLLACSHAPRLLGQAPDGPRASVRDLGALPPRSRVVVAGQMVEK